MKIFGLKREKHGCRWFLLAVQYKNVGTFVLKIFQKFILLRGIFSSLIMQSTFLFSVNRMKLKSMHGSDGSWGKIEEMVISASMWLKKQSLYVLLSCRLWGPCLSIEVACTSTNPSRAGAPLPSRGWMLW